MLEVEEAVLLEVRAVGGSARGRRSAAVEVRAGGGSVRGRGSCTLRSENWRREC